MNFKISLVIIIILSVIVPISIFFLINEPKTEIERKRTFLYTIPEEEIVSINIEKGGDRISFALEDNVWRIIDNKSSYPVNSTRWSGITFLIKEPVIQREISMDDKKKLSDFGLAKPIYIAKIELKNQSAYDDLIISFGNLSPDGNYQYIKLNDDNDIYALNTSFGNALKYLIESPPYPDWVYSFEKENINEILFYESGKLSRALSRDIFTENSNEWVICDILIDELTGDNYTENEPCDGTEKADQTYINSILDLMHNPKIENIIVTGLETEEEYLQYGINKNNVYVFLRNNTFNENGSLIIRPITLSLGNLERNEYQSSNINAVFQDTSDVVQLEENWANEIGRLIYCSSPKINQEKNSECNY